MLNRNAIGMPLWRAGVPMAGRKLSMKSKIPDLPANGDGPGIASSG